jgi:hypothetical protein
MVIETVTVNPTLADARFSKPNLVAGSPGPNPPASPPPAKK